MNKEKVRLVILKETNKGELFKNIDSEKFEKLDIGFTWNEFVEQVGYLVNEDYLTKPFYADDTIYYYNSNLTEKGETYLENHKWYKQMYTVIKEIKDWIK